MKKLALVLLTAMVLLTSCNVRATVNNSGIPTHFRTLEFYNGSAKIGDYKDVDMVIEIVTTTPAFGKEIFFYKYHITSQKQNIDEYILDSEALAPKFTL